MNSTWRISTGAVVLWDCVTDMAYCQWECLVHRLDHTHKIFQSSWLRQVLRLLRHCHLSCYKWFSTLTHHYRSCSPLNTHSTLSYTQRVVNTHNMFYFGLTEGYRGGSPTAVHA